MINNGWIQLHRKIRDFWVWNSDKKFNKLQAFIDILLKANHEKRTISFNGSPKNINRGQFYTSIEKLAAEWNWDRKTVRKFLKDLKNTNTIDFKTDKCGTTISIVNYDKYQGTKDNQTDNSLDTPMDKRTDTNKKKNNSNKKKNSFHNFPEREYDFSSMEDNVRPKS